MNRGPFLLFALPRHQFGCGHLHSSYSGLNITLLFHPIAAFSSFLSSCVLFRFVVGEIFFVAWVSELRNQMVEAHARKKRMKEELEQAEMHHMAKLQVPPTGSTHQPQQPQQVQQQQQLPPPPPPVFDDFSPRGNAAPSPSNPTNFSVCSLNRLVSSTSFSIRFRCILFHHFARTFAYLMLLSCSVVPSVAVTSSDPNSVLMKWEVSICARGKRASLQPTRIKRDRREPQRISSLFQYLAFLIIVAI